VAGNKRFVYVLKASNQNPRFYVGLTADVRGRLLIVGFVLVSMIVQRLVF
jgi:hypothetical protein